MDLKVLGDSMMLDLTAFIFRVNRAVTLPADLFVGKARDPPGSATASTR